METTRNPSASLPLEGHIEELAQRLFWPIIITGLLTLVFFSFSIVILNWLLELLALDEVQLNIYKPTEYLSLRLKVSFILALAVGLPLALRQLYIFARPGLYDHERRFTVWLVPSSLILFLTGAAVGLFIASPLLLDVMLAKIDEGPAEAALSLERTMSPVFTMVLGLGLVFQLPILMTLALQADLVTRQQLSHYRPYIYGLFIVVSTLLAPDPTLMAQVIVLFIFALMYELTLGGARVKRHFELRKLGARPS